MASLEQRRAALVESEGAGPHAAGPVIAKVSATVTLFLLTSCALADFCSSDVALHLAFAERGTENLILGSLLLLYTVGVAYTRVVEGGVWKLYQMLWLCNMSLLLSATGLVSGRPLLVGAASCCVAADQLCWYVDILGYAFFGKFVIGAAKYVLVATRVELLTTIHHIWFLPLCLWTMRGGAGMPARSYEMSVALPTMLICAARAVTPFALAARADGTVRVLNVDLAYEFDADVKLPFVHAMDHANPALYLPWMIGVGVVLNIVPVSFLYSVASRL